MLQNARKNESINVLGQLGTFTLQQFAGEARSIEMKFRCGKVNSGSPNVPLSST